MFVYAMKGDINTTLKSLFSLVNTNILNADGGNMTVRLSGMSHNNRQRS